MFPPSIFLFKIQPYSSIWGGEEVLNHVEFYPALFLKCQVDKDGKPCSIKGLLVNQ